MWRNFAECGCCMHHIAGWTVVLNLAKERRFLCLANCETNRLVLSLLLIMVQLMLIHEGRAQASVEMGNINHSNQSLILLFPLLFSQLKTSTCPITTLISCFTVQDSSERQRWGRLSECRQPCVQTRLLKGPESVPLAGLLHERSRSLWLSLWMKQREPEASTTEKFPQFLAGLSDLLSQATDSHSQETKCVLTSAEYLFSSMECIIKSLTYACKLQAKPSTWRFEKHLKCQLNMVPPY